MGHVIPILQVEELANPHAVLGSGEANLLILSTTLHDVIAYQRTHNTTKPLLTTKSSPADDFNCSSRACLPHYGLHVEAGDVVPWPSSSL